MQTIKLTAIEQTIEHYLFYAQMKLDAKTEKMYLLETKLESFRDRLVELNVQADTANRQLEYAMQCKRIAQSKVAKCSYFIFRTANSEKRKGEDGFRKLTAETDTLRTQIDKLKRINDNAMAENSRLTNELVDSECTNCLHKTKLIEAEKQVEQLKNQLQQYVQEVQRAEELLLRKASTIWSQY